MRSESCTAVCLVLAVLGLGCGCPKGNLILPARDVSFDLQTVVAGVQLTGHGSSPPSGAGISFDRATILAGDGTAGMPAPGDLLLFAISPGCHPDTTGPSVCDRLIRILLTVHGVANGAGSYTLDDARAELKLAVDEVAPATGPCPGKPGVTGCAVADAGTPAPYVSQTGIAGSLAMTRLAEDCTDVITSCALNAEGTFDLTAGSVGGDTVALRTGAITAADTFSYEDGSICNR